jgi:hypothetical protein
LELDAKTLTKATDFIAETVASGPRTRRELGAALEARNLSTDGQRMAYMIMHAELLAVICSGPMRGKQHTYAAFDERVPPGQRPQGDEALAMLAMRYFSTRGPATHNDFAWWAGLKATDARRGLEAVKRDLVTRQVDDRVYWFAQRVTPRATSMIHLVQCYDEAVISYSQTRDILQTPSAPFTVPRPTDGFVHALLLDGRLLGLWRRFEQKGQVRVETRIDRPLSNAEQCSLAEAVDRYRRFADVHSD